ncbi:N-acetylmuramoyl-L-alanine amidase [Longimicrobium sp.]|uniref:N-acetylmuramoyl-L-alanine amidase n=1 Tax=Longimicrobium sp. TaxID=2029185 RepID=UPI002E30AA23|nr:N-acetylmuramoyl-L-alanine amidase [Longimicrobium sp.]HEX6041389.1 N-acetylmuramoyl-L-alanine amidase [Longimicrobium sp.]
MQRTVAAFALLPLSLAACGPTASPSTGPGPSDTLRIGGARPGTGAIERLVYQPVSPALPAIPAANGALAIRVIEPTSGSARPRSQRTIIYGTVGTGQAALEINGTAVPVAPNGAFIAYLPTPQDGAWRLRAQRGGEEVTQTLEHARPSTGGGGSTGAASQNAVYATARAGTVTGGADTLATGSDAIYARPTPTGTYRWFFPRGARLSVVERRGDQYRVQLDPSTEAWVDARNLQVAETGAPPAPGAVTASTTRAEGWTDLRVRAGGRPFLVEVTQTGAVVTVYGATATTVSGGQATGEAAGGSARITVPTGGMPWGYKAWYEGSGDLVVRVRRPPAIDAANPLRGRRIVIDPGHPPAGATGPTGLYEGDANLAIALPLAEKLRARGAEVILTRTGREGLVSSTNSSQELGARVRLAVERDADLLISVHNNAFGEGQDPFQAHGTSVYYFHPMSAGLAQSLDREIVGVTRIRDIGARESNLALARPTWMPTALTESLFMPIPEQEAALRDPAFVDRLADAHVAGIEAFLRSRAGGGR